MDFSTSFALEKVEIYKIGSDEPTIITDLVLEFVYFENIFDPSLSMRLRLSDQGGNLISSLPIQGTERVVINLTDTVGEPYTYEGRVFKIPTRFTGERIQYYEIELVSIDGLLNEGIRVTKILKGKPEKIVRDILENYMKIPSDRIKTEASQFNVSFSPGKSKPFKIIQSLQNKTVSNSIKAEVKTSKGGSGESENKTTSELSPTDSDEYGKSSGSSGYFFYQNYDGFRFESIDTLYANKSPVLRLFQDRLEAETSPQEDKILDITYENEINVLNKLRLGAYSSLICYYNYSTGAYEEYTYSLAESYEKMGHQGTQSGLGKGQKDLSKYPTRVMSVLLDHETWYNGSLAASPEQRDGGEGATEFPDYQKYYMAQSISRMTSMNLQKAQIKISRRPSLKVGDSVQIFIPNQVVAQERFKQPWDPEHSGIYLVTSVQHKYLCKKARCYTFIGIMRDSYGAPGYASNVEG